MGKKFIAYEISSDNLHIVDLVSAFDNVMDKKNVLIYFHPPVDKEGFPVMKKLGKTHEEKERILKQYISHGNIIRKTLLERAKKDKNAVVVFSVKQVTDAITKFRKELDDKIDQNPQKKDA